MIFKSGETCVSRGAGLSAPCTLTTERADISERLHRLAVLTLLDLWSFLASVPGIDSAAQ